jgi:glutamate synthase (NADPH/NADH) large chain
MTAYSAQGKCGLYDPQFEHDACGIGIVANIKGRKSNAILAHGLEVLRKLSHRGGVGSEPDSGDGAGILLQIPHDFLRKAVMDRIDLPAPGQYGVGMIFLPTEAGARSDCERLLAKACLCEEQTLLGWRDVPVRPDGLGRSAKACMPYIRQVFIGRGPGVDSEEAFERKLFVIRKLTENAVREAGITGFYAASLSCRTIVYKGMLTPEQLGEFYLDLGDPDVVTALALVHSRYSTNTFPSWERAHPNRYIIHNGEINTLRGNINRMNARESMLATDVFGDDLNRVLPILNPDGSDSAMFDNVVEFLMLSGRPLPKVMTMMIPEPWEAHESMSDEKKAFYEYQSCVMEPWDGPAAIGFTDGVRVGAVLDRNGLRPARYYVTDDDMVVLASEVGVLDVPPERIVRKDRLRPGRMLLIDTEKGRIIGDDELKESMAKEHPYREWLDREMTDVSSLPEAPASSDGPEPLDKLQKAFGYSYEDLRLILAPLAQNGVDPVGAMGNDIPLAVLSEKPQMLYDYFKQLFAQVTNPPIDALREAIVTSSTVLLGSEGNLLGVGPESCHMIKLRSPVISDETLAKLKNIDKAGFRSVTLPILFDSDAGGAGLEKALDGAVRRRGTGCSRRRQYNNSLRPRSR